MAEQIVLSVPDLIDMAVGPPELNINLLNAVLQILASHVVVDGIRIQISSSIPVAHKPPQRIIPPNTFTVFNVHNASADGKLDLQKCRLEPKPVVASKPVQTLVVMDNSYAMPKLYFKNDLVEKSLPSASELVALCREDDGSTLVKMLDLLSITKRIEATELSIEKLMVMVCELCKKCKEISSTSATTTTSPTTTTTPTDTSASTVTPPTTSTASELAEKPSVECCETLKKELHELDIEHKELAKLVNTYKDLPSRVDRLKSVIENLNANQEAESNTEAAVSQAVVDDLEQRLARIEARCRCIATPGSSIRSGNHPSIVNSQTEVEEEEEEEEEERDNLSHGVSLVNKMNMDDLIEMKKEHDLLMSKMDIAETMICALQNEMVRLFQHLEDLGKFAKATRCQLLDAIISVEELRHNVQGLNMDVNMLVQERKDRKRQYEAIIDQMEQIKCVKADREEVEQMVVVKADITDMRTKVPFTQFEDMRKDMSLSLIDALEKIVETDLEWRRAIDSVHDLLNLKLDKSEAKQVAEDMTNRMIALKDKLRGFGMFRLSCESAATSEKYLKNVKCLVCNAQTYMNPNLSLPEVPRFGKFGRIADPDVRDFARITVPCSMRQEIKEPHTVIRFCGGRHTKLANGEKHSVKGDFIAQTGGVPLQSNASAQMARGTDGALYRVDVSNCNCGDS